MAEMDQKFQEEGTLERLLKIILGLPDEQRMLMLRHAEKIKPFEEDDKQRISARRTYSSYVNYLVGEESHWGLSRDISKGGLFIETYTSHSLNATITIYLPNIDNTEILEVAAKIVRSTPEGIGVEFLKSHEA